MSSILILFSEINLLLDFDPAVNQISEVPDQLPQVKFQSVPAPRLQQASSPNPTLQGNAEQNQQAGGQWHPCAAVRGVLHISPPLFIITEYCQIK